MVVVNVFASFPLSYIEVSTFSLPAVSGYYVVLILVLWLNGHRQQASTIAFRSIHQLRSGANSTTGLLSRLPLKWIIPPLLLAAILVSIVTATMPDDRLHVSFLDVGEGDAILMA